MNTDELKLELVGTVFQGPVGPAGTIEVGAVAIGAPGSNPTIVNSGTPQAAVLDFTIPQGPVGPKGDPGDGAVAAISAAQAAQATANEADGKADSALAQLVNLLTTVNPIPGEIANILATIATLAPKNNAALTGAPTAPNPAVADNSQAIATTSFVQALITSLSANVAKFTPGNNYAILGGGLILQWGVMSPTDATNTTWPYNIPFPTAALFVGAGSNDITTGSYATSVWWTGTQGGATADKTKFGVRGNNHSEWWFAIGY